MVGQARAELGGNVWTGTIPKFHYTTEIKYRLIAKDIVNNIITTQDLGYTYQYTVIPEFPISLILPLFMIATLLAIIYEKKRKKQYTTVQHKRPLKKNMRTQKRHSGTPVYI